MERTLGRALAYCWASTALLILFVFWWTYPPLHVIQGPTVGLIFAFILGHLLVQAFILCTRDIILAAPKSAQGPAFPPWLMGLLERAIFFGVGVYLLCKENDEALVVLSGGWLGLKLALNWLPRLVTSRPSSAHDRDTEGMALDEELRRDRVGAQVAFWAAILSIVVALTGAAIASGKLAPVP